MDSSSSSPRGHNDAAPYSNETDPQPLGDNDAAVSFARWTPSGRAARIDPKHSSEGASPPLVSPDAPTNRAMNEDPSINEDATEDPPTSNPPPQEGGSASRRGSRRGSIPPTNAYMTLARELLSTGVGMDRVSELCRGLVSEKDLHRMAREVVAAAATAEGDTILPGYQKNAPWRRRSSFLQELGMSVLERSNSAHGDAAFLTAHTSNLASDAPERMKDPLFFTIMNDPVVISSGYVMDRSSILDDNGGLKFRLCPFTRVPIKKDVYPVVFLRKEINHYKERKVKCMLETARTHLDQRNFDRFWELIELSGQFLDGLGDETYIHLSSRVTKLSLEGYEMAYNNSCQPKELAKIYVRIYQTSPAFGSKSEHNKIEGTDDSAEDEKSDGAARWLKACFKKKVANLLENAKDSIQNEKFDEAAQWLDACEVVNSSCEGLNVNKMESTAKLRLSLAKARGDDDLSGPRRLVYREIMLDPDAVARFCEEEGTGVDDLRDLRPIVLWKRNGAAESGIHDWRSIVQSDPLEGRVFSVIVQAGENICNGGRREGLGGEGALRLALYDSNEELVAWDRVARCYDLINRVRTIWPEYVNDVAGSPEAIDKVHPMLGFGGDDKIVARARAGFTYRLEYMGDLYEPWCFCKIYSEPSLENGSISAQQMTDPDNFKGLYIGPTDDGNKAHGNGELVYYVEGLFVGKFRHGTMVEGVAYDGAKPKRTMLEGRWTRALNGGMIKKYVFDAVLFGGDAASDDSGDESDSEHDDARHISEEEGPRATVTFRNARESTLTLFWLNDAGEEVLLDFDPLRPGGTVVVNTFQGHRFVAYDEDRGYRREFMVSAGEDEHEKFVIRRSRKSKLRAQLKRFKSVRSL